MAYYPILLDLEDKRALVVGGGQVAERKIETLLGFGASVSLSSKKLTDKIRRLVEEGKIRYLGTEFQERDLEGVFLVIAATNDKELNHRVSELAKMRGLLINAVDQPLDCNFIVPSIVKRGDLLLAVSTSGKSPALAKKLRKDLERQFGEEYEIFLTLMGRLRETVLSMGFSQEENSRIFHEVVTSPVLALLANQQWDEVEACLRDLLPKGLAVEGIVQDLTKGYGG